MAAHAHDEAGLVRALIAGIVANFLVAISKLLAFFFTGSSAMLAEALHSLADSSNQGLLALGLKRAARKPTESHPFGYGKERYFWSFIVALLVFSLGAVFAIYEGIHKIANPSPIENPIWSYGALAFGMVVEALALRVAWREFSEWRTENPGPLVAGLKQTKDPTLPTVLFEDTAALVGLLVAATGVTVTLITGDPVFDAVASIIIGVVLLGVAWFLAIESHSLLMGEAASEQDVESIRAAIASEDSVTHLVELMTLQRSPKEILVAITVEFRDGLDTDGVEDAVIRVEDAIRAVVPDARHIFVEAGAFRRRRDSALKVPRAE